MHKALARMMNWAKVTRQIYETEFPERDLVSSLNVLFMSNGNQAARHLSGTDRETLMKIARAFNLDGDKLVHQTEALLPIAEHELRLDASLPSLDAWAKALARAQKNHTARRSYATDVLRKSLQSYAIASGSTSGIAKHLFGCQAEPGLVLERLAAGR